eukprot:TRINITY_DN42661_c0_g1_i2.p3 TRINITY_DN42661_c0_g1~~TRINITY_DN42661_c0_g1_i2.p3  ORF type:complete len:124 (+),score=26.32 TRINITY_DN42661_c0_g1_i2:185-556(+)
MDAVSQSLSSVEKIEGVEQMVQQREVDDQVKSLQDKLWQQNHEYTKLQKTHEDTVRQIQWLQQSHDDLLDSHLRLKADESKFKAEEDEKIRKVEKKRICKADRPKEKKKKKKKMGGRNRLIRV